MEERLQGHGFHTREDWTQWFSNYNIALSGLNNGSYELIQSDIPDEQWIETYKRNSQRVREAYRENENMLDWHIRWFTRTPDRWTKEIADPLLATLFRYVTRIQDLGTAHEIANSLIGFYTPLGDEKALMKCYTIRAFASGFLDIIHLSDRVRENCVKARELYEKHFADLTPEECSMGLSIFDLEIDRVVNQLKIRKDNGDLLDEIIDWCETGIRYAEKAMEMDRGYDFNAVLPDFDNYLGGAVLCISPEGRTERQITSIYEAACRMYHALEEETTNDVSFRLRTELVYHMACRLKGLYSEQQILEDVRRIMDEHGHNLLTEDTYSRHAAEAVETIYLIGENLMPGGAGDNKLYEDIGELFIRFCATRPYSTYMDYISASYNYGYILLSLPHVTGRRKLLGNLLKLTVFRQVQTAMHSMMVGNLSTQIFDSLMTHAPEVFVGQMDTRTVEEVYEKQEQLRRYLYCGALLHDIGKLLCSSVVNAQSHRLTDFEFEVLQFHPTSGGEMLKDIPDLADFRDLALGHHKSFDGTRGYPKEFDNTASPKKIFIDIISLCDSLDAATDNLGRNYTHEKRFERVLEELQAGRGTRYSDVLVDLLHRDKPLQESLRNLLEEGRREVYCEVHQLILAEFSVVACKKKKSDWPYNLKLIATRG